MFECVCVLILSHLPSLPPFFVDLALIVENLDVITENRMHGRGFVTQYWLAIEICLH